METNNKPTTVKEILEEVRTMLGNINIPAAQVETIGIPIARGINGITLCIDTFNRKEAEQAQKEAEQAEPDGMMIEVVPAEENEDNA